MSNSVSVACCDCAGCVYLACMHACMQCQWTNRVAAAAAKFVSTTIEGSNLEAAVTKGFTVSLIETYCGLGLSH